MQYKQRTAINECASFLESIRPAQVVVEAVKPFPDSKFHSMSVNFLKTKLYEARRSEHMIPQFSESEKKHFALVDEVTAVLKYKQLMESVVPGSVKKDKAGHILDVKTGSAGKLVKEFDKLIGLKKVTESDQVIIDEIEGMFNLDEAVKDHAQKLMATGKYDPAVRGSAARFKEDLIKSGATTSPTTATYAWAAHKGSHPKAPKVAEKPKFNEHDPKTWPHGYSHRGNPMFLD